MAANNYPAIYKRFNGSDWDTFYFATLASQVSETLQRKWLTSDQQEMLNSYVGNNELVRLNNDGVVGISYMPLYDLDNRYFEKDTVSTQNVTSDVTFGGLTEFSGETRILNRLKFGTSDGMEMEGTVIDGVDVFKFMELSGNHFRLEGTSTALNVDLNNDPYIRFTVGDGVNFYDKRLRGVATPIDPQDAVNKEWVESITADGLKPMPPLRLATTATLETSNNQISGLQQIDGINTVAGDRVLVKDQDNDSQNGVYVVAAGAWTKNTNQSQKGYYGQVLEGITNRGTWFYADTDTDWLLHSVPDEYGVLLNGGLELEGMSFGIKDNGVTLGMLAPAVTNEFTKYLARAGGTMTGNINMGGKSISNLISLNGSVAGSLTIDWGANEDLLLGDNSTAGALAYFHKGNMGPGYMSMNNHPIRNLAPAVNGTDAVNLDQLNARNQTHIGTGSPSTTGYNTGDLYFQHTAPVNP